MQGERDVALLGGKILTCGLACDQLPSAPALFFTLETERTLSPMHAPHTVVHQHGG